MEKWYLKLSGVLILVILLIVVIFSVRKEKEENEPKTTETSLVYNEYQTKKSAINYYKIKDGVLYGRGRNTEGQLGLGKIEPLEVDYNYDVEIAKNVIHVDASNNGTVVYITENGELYGIGNNSSGQLGQSIEGKNRLSDEVNISSPVLIATEVRYALVGINFTMYLTEDDKLYVLGDNANGQLGNGEAKPVMAGRYTSDTTPYSAEPVLVMENVRYIDCGLYNLAAITKRGDLYMWGDNSFGEMGNGRVGNKMPTASIDVVSEPYLVMKNIRKVTIEEHTVYAETMQGEVYTWGDSVAFPKKMESEVEITEHVQESDEKENDITADNQDEVITTDKVSEQDEIVNQDNVDEISLYVVETIMMMDQAYAEEKEAIIKIISNFSDIDYENARVLDSCHNEIIEGDVLLLIANNEEKDIKVYGYKSEEYTCRGIVIRYGGINSYFDYSWDDIRGPRGLYVADFDKDGKDEIAICLSGGHGTGHSVERLIIFEESDESRQLVSYELTSEKQQSEIERILDFDIDLANWEFIVNRNGQSERVIDIKKHASRNSNNEFGIDYLNNIHYEVQNDKIVMYTKVGIEFDTFKGFTVGFQNDEGKIGFDVIYEDGQFRLE